MVGEEVVDVVFDSAMLVGITIIEDIEVLMAVVLMLVVLSTDTLDVGVVTAEVLLFAWHNRGPRMSTISMSACVAILAHSLCPGDI